MHLVIKHCEPALLSVASIASSAQWAKSAAFREKKHARTHARVVFIVFTHTKPPTANAGRDMGLLSASRAFSYLISYLTSICGRCQKLQVSTMDFSIKTDFEQKTNFCSKIEHLCQLARGLVLKQF